MKIKKINGLKLDEIDFSILSILREDARLPLKDIASRIEQPRSTVHSRIKKLESAGVIKNYTINLSYKKLGMQLKAIIMISFDKENGADQLKLADKLAKLPEVQEVLIVAGEKDIIIKVRTESVEKLGDFSVKTLKDMKGVGSTVTYVVLKSVSVNNALELN